MIDLNELKRSIDEYCESEEGKRYFALERKKDKIKLKRFIKFEKWLKNNSFDNLISKLISKHNETYFQKCYDKGFEVKPNNLLEFILDYIEFKFETIDVAQLDCEFPNHIWFFKGYFFQTIWGQGSINRVYDKNFNLIISL